VHGGIAQGAGPALIEGVAYDPGSGQVLTGSFMDYAVPRADMFPMFKVAATEDPTLGNVLRVKGGGEGGTTPASAVIINAVLHALAPLGVRHLDMPATPQRVWAAIQAAKA
jgi:carbon-monoxide dehydrogenase large subunit